jgi:hypothetical protein
MMQEHFLLEETVTEEETSFVFNNAADIVIKGTFKQARLQSITYFYTHVLKQQMKTKDAQNLHLTKEQYFQGTVN